MEIDFGKTCVQLGISCMSYTLFRLVYCYVISIRRDNFKVNMRYVNKNWSQ